MKKIKLKKPTNGVAFGIRLVVTLIVIFALLLMAAEKLNIASITDITDGIRNFIAGLTPGPGYPYQINSSSVEDIGVLNGNLFILKNDETLSLDSTAKTIKETTHTYSNPTMAINGAKAIVYDRNGNRFRVENRTNTLFTSETDEDEKIITAAIGAKGNIALAMFSDSCASKLDVYSSNYKSIVFSWTCTQDSIVSVDLSDNGNYAAVAVVGARDGEIYSKVIIFDFDLTKPLSEFEYPGTAILGVKFVKNDNVVAVGDNLISFISNLKDKSNTSYGSSTLSNFAFSDDGNTVLVLSKHGSTNDVSLTCYSDNFKESFSKDLDSSVKYVYVDGGRVSILLENKVYVYKTNGSLYREYKADNTAIAVFNMGNKTYLYSIGEITKCE